MKIKFAKFYPLIIFLFAFLLYANTIPNFYNLDDELVTMGHRTTSLGLDGISDILTEYYYEDDMGYKYDYRPITHISFALEHQFFGENPHVSHAINVLLYALLCLLIFFLSNKFYPDKSPLFGFVVAIVFAVLPIHTEVVASIKNRDEIFSLLFGLISFYVIFFRDKQKITSLILAIIFMLLSLFSKPSTIVFIFLIPFYFLLIKQSKSYVYFVVWVLLNSASFSYFFINNYKNQIIFPLLLMLLMLLFFMFKKVKKINLKSVSVKVVLIGLIIISYILVLLSFFRGGGLLFLIAIYFCLTAIVVSYKFNRFKLYIYLLCYPIFLTVIFFYNLPYLLLLYSFLFSILNDDLSRRELSLSLLFFLMIGAPFFYLYSVFNLLMLVPILLLFSKGRFKYLVLVFSVLSLLINSEYFIYLITNLTIVLFIIFKYFKVEIRFLKYFQSIKLFALFLSIGLSFLFSYNKLSSYENLPKGEVYTDVYEKINEINQYDDIVLDRPLLFVENPLVENWNIKNRLVAGITSSGFYVKKLIFPYPLSFYYGYNQIDIISFINVDFFSSLLILMLTLILIVYLLFKKEKLMLFSLLFVMLNLLPYSNFFLPIAGVVGERLAFTSSFGFSLFLVGLLFLLHNRIKKTSYLLIPFSFVFILYISFVIYRNELWENKIKLFSHDIENLKESANANALLGYSIMELANSNKNLIAGGNKAKPYFEKAINLYPDYLNWHYDLGRLNLEIGNFNEAKGNFLNAIEIDSTYTDSYFLLFNTYGAAGELDKALELGNFIMEIEPNNVDMLFAMSEINYYLNRYQDVLKINNKIVMINDNIPEVYLNKAYAYVGLDEYDLAYEFYLKGAGLAPNHRDLLVLKKMIQEKGGNTN